MQNAGDPIGRGHHTAVRPDVANGRRRSARVRGRRQSNGQNAQPGHPDADVPLSARRECQAARLPAEAELRLVNGRRGARHVGVRPEERAIRRPVHGAVHRGQAVRHSRVQDETPPAIPVT